MSTYDIRSVINKRARDGEAVKKANTGWFSREVMAGVRSFHRKFPHYAVTPLHSLDHLAHKCRVEKVWVKDEAHRFGLNSFKVLGGSYAIMKYVSQVLQEDISQINWPKLQSLRTRERLGNLTFVTATDGNHGRGVAWAARQLGQHAVVFMPKGSAQVRVDTIRKEGARVEVTDCNYDETVRMSRRFAANHNGVVVQDTAWEGYHEVPLWIMQGYLTVFSETLDQLGADKPTHVFLQAGVGALAGAMQAAFVEVYGSAFPMTIVIEPHGADCMFRSAQAGHITSVDGDLDTIMAGLACGEPNPIAWEILRDYADAFLSCPDYLAATGMRVLANPLQDDPKVIAGESAALGIGILRRLTMDHQYDALAKDLEINAQSRVLVVSTEGNTDPSSYQAIVWDGKDPLRVD